jgi:DNA-binding NarL/FixJ family response regulator
LTLDAIGAVLLCAMEPSGRSIWLLLVDHRITAAAARREARAQEVDIILGIAGIGKFMPTLLIRKGAGHPLRLASEVAVKRFHAINLTPRESEVLAEIAGGARNKAIAATLHIGLRTVERHREILMQKLDIDSVAGLTKYALAHGLTKPHPIRKFY